MMKKAIKKLLAALLAVAMVCAMAIPAFAYNPGETEEDLNKNHSYIAFQIFKGVISKDNPTLSGVDWGQHIPDDEDFLAELKRDLTIGGEFENATTPQDVLAVISKWHDSDNNSIAFARFVCHYLYSKGDPKSSIVGGGGAIKIPEPGYYLIVDNIDIKEGDFYHAYNSFLLVNDTHQGEYNVIINHKVVKPTVEKKVYDNQDGTSTGDFGSSADHAINEKFQFQLIAKLPASKDNGRAYDYYDKYTVCFNDTLSAGITFDNLDTVKIANVDGGDSKEITNYKFDDTDLHEAGHPTSFKLSIDDVKTCAAAAGLNLNDGATITVTYTAHLNDKATVNTANGSNTTDNKNSVFLQYSNNPRIDTSLDHTTTSDVCVYTYQLNNTKRQNTEDGPVLEGAGFRLYSDEACNDAQEIKLKKNTDGTYSPYFGADAGVEMFSDKDGKFNVKGLDAGTYYLKETTPPTGYSACANKEIVISATHDVNHVDLSGNLSTTIINKKAGGITLPSTGGIGTTIFYVVGGGLMVAAIVLLVTKKRMENK